jgi:hypothetical protein
VNLVEEVIAAVRIGMQNWPDHEVREVHLFGSILDPRDRSPEDVDLLFVLADDLSEVRLTEVAGRLRLLAAEVEAKIGIPVDMLRLTGAELKSSGMLKTPGLSLRKIWPSVEM